MNVTINIDDDSFSELVKKGVDNMPAEKVGAIAAEAIMEVFKKEEAVKEIIFRSKNWGYSGPSYSDLRPEIVEAIRAAMPEDKIQELRDRILEILETGGRNLLVDAVTAMFAERLFEEPMKLAGGIRDALIDHIREGH